MRRAILVALVLGLVAVPAVPAFAHRDPFDPVIRPDALTGAAVTGATETGTIDPIDQSLAEVGTDRMPPTGADVTGWLVLAYTLGAVGAGSLVLAKS